MRHRSKVLLTALSATIVLGALVSTTSARRFAASNWTLRATWSSLTFVGTESGITVRCPVTLEGSFHSRTISKALEQLIGYVTQAGANETHCTGGSARALTTNLPWHFRYNGFIEALPNITGIKIRMIGSGWLVQTAGVFPVACLYRSTAASPTQGTVDRNTATGEVTGLTPEAARIALTDQTLSMNACPSTGGLSVTTSSLTVQGASTKITVTLIQ